MLDAYSFDTETKEYKGICPVDTNLQGVPELPPDCTIVQPLKKQEGYAVCFNGTEWEYVEDHRRHIDAETGLYEGGTPYWLPEDTWQSEPRYMEELGPLPEDALLERPEKPQHVIDEEELERIRDLREEECFSIVDRSQLWYSKNVDTPEKQAELDAWYEAWLHVTDEKPYIIPERPIWLNPKN